MIPLTWMVPLLILAFWDAWQSLGARTDTLESTLPIALVASAVAAQLLWRIVRGQPLRPLPVLPFAGALLVYAAACLVTPPLIRIAVAAVTTLCALHFASDGDAFKGPFIGLILLALPVMPTLEFYTAYPMRRISATITVHLLDLQGLYAVQEGVALRIGERMFEFDAPCSGVRMLWASCFLVSAVGLLRRFDWMHYAGALVLATVMAVLANALRASSLVYVEAEVFPIARGEWLHAGVGVAVFVMSSVLLLFMMDRLARRSA